MLCNAQHKSYQRHSSQSFFLSSINGSSPLLGVPRKQIGSHTPILYDYTPLYGLCRFFPWLQQPLVQLTPSCFQGTIGTQTMSSRHQLKLEQIRYKFSFPNFIHGLTTHIVKSISNLYCRNNISRSYTVCHCKDKRVLEQISFDKYLCPS